MSLLRLGTESVFEVEEVHDVVGSEAEATGKILRSRDSLQEGSHPQVLRTVVVRSALS